MIAKKRGRPFKVKMEHTPKEIKQIEESLNADVEPEHEVPQEQVEEVKSTKGPRWVKDGGQMHFVEPKEGDEDYDG